MENKGFDPSENRHLQSEFSSSSKYYEVYDDVLTFYEPHQRLRALHASVMPRGKVNIVDAGGGTGLLTRHLKAEDPHRKIEIFDLSQEMTSVAAAKGVRKNNIHISSITHLVRTNGQQVEDSSIDGIMTNNVIYILSIEQIHNFLREAHRVLKSGGRLSIASMQTVKKEAMDKFLESIQSDVANMERAGWVPQNSSHIFFDTNKRLTQNAPTTFTIPEIVKLAETFGFHTIYTSSSEYMGTAFFVAFEKQ
ncbi:MAG: class I SAM-dependent methyltransferase [Bdellovibrionales bacterium]|nr:class I SAM-dependent methyltransferase [Bdellovibrionales bacterium]